MTLKKEPKRKKGENVDRLKVEDLTKTMRGTGLESQDEQKIKSPIAKPSEINEVKDAYTRDVGRGIARIDYATMDLLGIFSGDVIEIMGKTATVAKALPVYPSDEGQRIIRFDGLIRSNAGTQVGDKVKLRKVETADAVEVFVEHFEPILPIDERYIADSLDKVPICKGDYIQVPYFGGSLTFKVTKIKADHEVAIVREKTVFHLTENKAEVNSTLLAQAGKKIEQIEESLEELKSILNQLRQQIE